MTLVELLIVVVIVGVMISLAVPSYRDYVRRGNRSDAIRAMLGVAACQERIRAGAGYYDTTRCLAESGTRNYRLSLDPLNQPATLAFTVVAEPFDPYPGDYCGKLYLDHTGSRGTSGDAERTADCWSGR